MKIFIEREKKTIEYKLEKPKPLIEILKDLNIHLESVILVKNDTICLEEELVENNDEIKLLSVISGG